MIKNKILNLSLVIISALSLFACSSNNISTISTDGSTSMEKVIGILSEDFTNKNPNLKVTYNPTGSGSGIEAVKNETCDIGLSSRYLKQNEKDEGLVETIIAYDGIAIVVNKNNTINNLTLENLKKIYMGEITNWKELGGKDQSIVLIGREAGSGTRDGFESITDTKEKCKYRQELTSTGDVLATVRTNENAIGYASLASISKDDKVISINNIMPTEESIKNASYVIQRPFVYVTKKDKPLNENAKKFFDYSISSEVSALIGKAGAVSVN